MSRSAPAKFALCINNVGTPVSLEIGKVYRVIATEKIARDMRLVRVIDESGEDYLYSADQFVEVKLPPAGRQALSRAR
jgi:NAD(P)H-flavin reductase